MHSDQGRWTVLLFNSYIDDGNALDCEVMPLRDTRDVQLKQVATTAWPDARRRVCDEEFLPTQQPAHCGSIARRTTADGERLLQDTCCVLGFFGEVTNWESSCYKHVFNDEKMTLYTDSYSDLTKLIMLKLVTIRGIICSAVFS